jgi:hypothetical protein
VPGGSGASIELRLAACHFPRDLYWRSDALTKLVNAFTTCAAAQVPEVNPLKQHRYLVAGEREVRLKVM